MKASDLKDLRDKMHALRSEARTLARNLPERSQFLRENRARWDFFSIPTMTWEEMFTLFSLDFDDYPSESRKNNASHISNY